MPIYFYWGEDDFTLSIAVKKLKESVLDPAWIQFNYNKIPGDTPESTIVALNLAMTPVFGTGGRLIWLDETTICQNNVQNIRSELERILPKIPATSHLLLTSSKKPDRRLKSTKLLEKSAEIKEFSPISPWKTDQLIEQTQQFAKELGVKMSQSATELLAESVGNNTRQLWNELEKLSVYQKTVAIDTGVISTLVNCSARNSIDLSKAILKGQESEALLLIDRLISRNEPSLKIVATLVGQFRTWIAVKLQIEIGEQDDRVIAKVAEVGNFYRIRYLAREVKSISSQKLLASLPILVELEFSLKRGRDLKSAWAFAIIKMCQNFH